MSQVLASLRKQRRYSQLELALRSGVSQRHLSCIETGRARAGRETLAALLDALGASLAERNQALLAAGYAPAHAESALDAPAMAPVRAALAQLLQAQDATPTLVLDGEYNVVMANRGLGRLLALLGPGMPTGPLNLLRATLGEGGLRERCLNGDELCAELWGRAQREAEHLPRLKALLDELRPGLKPWAQQLPSGQPALALRLRAADGQVLSFYSAFTSFGTPLDITLASLKVEHLFPADEATRACLAG